MNATEPDWVARYQPGVPVEIELPTGVIRRVPGVDDVAVVGHRRPDGGEVVVASSRRTLWTKPGSGSAAGRS